MEYPEWLERLPRADVGFPGAEGRLMAGPHGQVVFWSFLDGGSVPAHKHGAQLGFVLSGAVTLVVDGATETFRAGDHFFIDAGQVHSAEIAPGSCIVEVFEEADRHHPRLAYAHVAEKCRPCRDTADRQPTVGRHGEPTRARAGRARPCWADRVGRHVPVSPS